MKIGTRIGYVEAHIAGQEGRLRGIVESLVDVPEKYRDGGIPSWAGTFGLKRHLFNWFNRYDHVHLFVRQPEEGVFEFKTKSFFFHSWTVHVTPELLYLMTHIIYTLKQQQGTQDILFIFRGRKMFLPFELQDRFCATVQQVMQQHGNRIVSLIEALYPAEEPEVEEKKVEEKDKRVLH
jgi:hypothetical protein